MTQFNPITGGPVQSSATQRMLADDKAAQLRKSEQSKRTSAADTFEPRVENTEQVEQASDQQQKQQQARDRKKKRKRADEPDPDKTIDIRA